MNWEIVVMLGQFLNTWGVMYDLHQEGQLPESQWLVVRSDIKASFSTEGGKRFWDEIGHLTLQGRFWLQKVRFRLGADRHQMCCYHLFKEVLQKSVTRSQKNPAPV